MKQRIVELIFLACVIPYAAWAGMPVTDTTSYTYYVEILKKDLEQIENQVKNIEAVNTVYTETQKVYDSVTGVYDKIKEFYDLYKEIRERVAGDVSASQDYILKYMDDALDMDEYLSEGGYVDVEKVLDDVYLDTRNPANDTTIFNEWPKRRAMQQAAIKKAIVEAEKIAQALPKDMLRLEKLVNQIGETEDLKASQDLSNHFLAEILGVMQELKALIAKDVAAKQLKDFQGVDGQDQELVKYGYQTSPKIPELLNKIVKENPSGVDIENL